MWSLSVYPSLCLLITPSAARYCLSGLPVDCQMKNITNPDQTSLLLEDLIIWTNYEIEVAAYNGAGRGTYSHKVTEWTLQGGEGYTQSLKHNQQSQQPSSSKGLSASVGLWIATFNTPFITCSPVMIVPWRMLSMRHSTCDWCYYDWVNTIITFANLEKATYSCVNQTAGVSTNCSSKALKGNLRLGHVSALCLLALLICLCQVLCSSFLNKCSSIVEHIVSLF